jgi:hypothetical protein
MTISVFRSQFVGAALRQVVVGILDRRESGR